DVNEGRVIYHLKEDVNYTSDSFGFSVVDTGENTVGSQVFRLQWSWVSLQKEEYHVNETSRELLITLRRRGYLGETSFVTVELMNDTARVQEDLHTSYPRQVQFNPGQRSAEWRVRVVDDLVYEGSEVLTLTLTRPVMTALEMPLRALITIKDEEDVSRVEFGGGMLEYQVEEDVGEVELALVRQGDVSEELLVACITSATNSSSHDSATGTVPTTVLSYSDYISRPDDPTSMVKVVLTGAMGGVLGHHTHLTVTILPDPKDVPVVFFGSSEYKVEESVGSVEVTVWRTGTDLTRVASVQVRSVVVQVVDDLGVPRLEGLEAFTLVLHLPHNASLGDPATASLTIDDSLSDCECCVMYTSNVCVSIGRLVSTVPRFQFREEKYSGYEGDGEVTAWIIRGGDLSHHASVRCYTRQDTAHVTDDFDERPDTNASFVHFLPGESERPCTVILVNDLVHEGEEQIYLVLGSPVSPTAGGASVGVRHSSTLTINDQADRATVGLEETRVSVEEPEGVGEARVVRLGVVRGGDTSTRVAVRVHTKDGSATSGYDYYPLSQ
ncbi:FRAS1-related extracellular matrix protein 2-like 1, partial [Homarus americanus]